MRFLYTKKENVKQSLRERINDRLQKLPEI